MVLLLLHHALRCLDHYVATALATEHLLEFRFVLTRSQGVILPEVNPTTIWKVSFALLIIIGVGEWAGSWGLAVVVLGHWSRGWHARVDLLVGHQVWLRQLQLALLVAHFVLLLASPAGCTLPIGGRAGSTPSPWYHAQLTHVCVRLLDMVVCSSRRVRVVVNLATTSWVHNPWLFTLALLAEKVVVGCPSTDTHEILNELRRIGSGVALRHLDTWVLLVVLYHEVVPGSPETYQALLVLFDVRLLLGSRVAWHWHLCVGNGNDAEGLSDT